MNVTFGGVATSYLKDDDPPEVVEALRALSALGCHGDDMEAAGEVLRARPSCGEYLIVHGGKAQRAHHRCLWGDVPEFTAARVVWIAPAEVIE